MKRISLHRRGAVVVASLLVLGAGMAIAETVVVHSESVVVRSGKGSMYPPVGEVQKNGSLEVLERQAGGWLKVKVGEKEGFVREDSLKPRNPGMLSGAASALNTVSGNNPDAGAVAAGRGIQDDAITYATQHGYNTEALKAMIESRDRVAGQRWIQFTTEGKVGPAAGH
jgi:hypothetical protein